MKIVYLCSVKNKAYGGIDVIFRHAEYLNELTANTYILDLKKINYFKNFFRKKNLRYSEKKILFLNSIHNITSNDFVIIPEIYVKKYAAFFLEKQIRFAIFVQRPYLIRQEDVEFYSKASLVISTSNFISDYINEVIHKYEYLNNHQITLSISKINSLKNNKKLITYMQRKMDQQSHFLIDQLKHLAPKGWSFLCIDNLSHEETLNILAKSKIFLSFTHLEGFGLPPIEAALSGNLVLGYSGVGGNEYFKKPIFHKIEYGNIVEFKKIFLKTINDYDTNTVKTNKIKFQRSELAKHYSIENEKQTIIALKDKIYKLMSLKNE